MECRVFANLSRRPFAAEKGFPGIGVCLNHASVIFSFVFHPRVIPCKHTHTHRMNLLAGYSGRYSCSNERKKECRGVVAVQVTALFSDSLTTLIFFLTSVSGCTHASLFMGNDTPSHRIWSYTGSRTFDSLLRLGGYPRTGYMTLLWGTYGNGGLTPIGLRGHYILVQTHQ
jgi:hypothetical protein